MDNQGACALSEALKVNISVTTQDLGCAQQQHKTNYEHEISIKNEQNRGWDQR